MEIHSLKLDQWESIFELTKTTKDNLKNYDETLAWPTILDDFNVWASK